MKKRMMALTSLILVGAMTLVACSSSSSTSSTSETTTEVAEEATTEAAEYDGEVTTITFIRAGVEDTKNGAFLEIIENFEAEYPQYKVEYSEADWGDIETKVSTACAAGTPYDVVHSGVAYMSSHVALGQYASMNDYIADWDGIGDYYDATLSAGSIGDDLYGIATYADARVFAYNTELFTEVGIEEVPTNWEELYEAHAALVKKDDAGNVIQTGLALSTSGTNINQYLQIFSIQNGLAGLVDAGTDEILFNTDEAIEAAEFLASLSDLGLILWDSMSFDTNPFVAGTAAMAIINETEFNLANEALGGVLEIAPMFGNVETATFSGSHMFHMSAQTAHPDATWALIEYMTSAESLEIWMDATGAAPVRASLEEHYLELSPTYGEFFMEAVSVGHPASLVTYNSAMVTILDSTMEEIFYGVSEPADALNAAAIEVQAEIDNQ